MVQALDASVTDVFDERAGQTAGTAPPEGVRPAVVVGRAGGSAPVTLEGGVVFRRLSPGPLAGADLFESTYPPGALATGVDELVTHAGYEVGTVSTGELTIDFPDERVVLRAGDSVTFPCDLPHRLGNLGEVAAVATWLIVHP